MPLGSWAWPNASRAPAPMRRTWCTIEFRGAGRAGMTNAYTTSLPADRFETTTGVTGPSIALTADGWSAVVGHGSSTKTCAIFVGSTSAAPATQEHVPQCATPPVPEIDGDTGSVTTTDTVETGEGG